jgi:hypothetical protein
VDGFRYPEVAAAQVGGYFDRMRRALLEKAGSLGYDVIDLDRTFFERRRSGERFEFARDGHWSGIGHAAAFDAVMESSFMQRLLSGSVSRSKSSRTRRGSAGHHG